VLHFWPFLPEVGIFECVGQEITAPCCSVSLFRVAHPLQQAFVPRVTPDWIEVGIHF